MVDRDTYQVPETPTRRARSDVPGALSGSRLFEQPQHRAAAEQVLAFIEGPGPVALEVGFDHGISLLSQARAQPDWRWLGFEIRRRRVAAVREHAGPNCLPMRGDARTWLAAVLPDACLHRIDVLFPTPALKGRHLLWTPEFVADAARVLRPDGVLHVATDVPDLARLIGELLTGWTEVDAPPAAPERSRRERVCRRDGLRVWRFSVCPPK